MKYNNEELKEIQELAEKLYEAKLKRCPYDMSTCGKSCDYFNIYPMCEFAIQAVSLYDDGYGRRNKENRSSNNAKRPRDVSDNGSIRYVCECGNLMFSKKEYCDRCGQQLMYNKIGGDLW